MCPPICFDIETIPQQTELSTYQKELLASRVATESKYTGKPADDPELIRKVKSVNPYLGEIVCIGLFNDKTKKSVGLVGSEYDILKEFWEIIRDEDRFISFNGIDFDCPWIDLRSAKHGIIPPKVQGVLSHPFLTKPRFRTWPHFDVAKWASDWNPRLSVSLKVLCEFLGIPSPKEGEISASGVEEAYLNGKIHLISEYCQRDLKATYRAYRFIKNYVSNQI